MTLENSFYLLHFLSNREIEENFKFYIEKGLHGMEKRLPQLKIRERHKEFLNEHYEKYVRLPSNFEQAKAIYDQLKRYR